MSADDIKLLPCPFCGGPVDLEQTVNKRAWWGVVCRNTTGNRGGSCAVSIRPSASPEAAIERWNRRAAPSPQGDAERLDFIAEHGTGVRRSDYAKRNLIVWTDDFPVAGAGRAENLRNAVDTARSTPAKGGEHG